MFRGTRNADHVCWLSAVANFALRQSIGDVAVFINQKFKYILKMNSEKKVEVAPSSGNIANALLCAVNSSDTLLELYRDYTDKEKLHWIIRDYKTLEKKFRNVVLENKNLKAKNEKLNKRIKEDDLQYPSQLNGEKYVSVKAYFKLRERYKQMEDRFWEVMQELNNLKSNSDCERL